MERRLWLWKLRFRRTNRRRGSWRKRSQRKNNKRFWTVEEILLEVGVFAPRFFRLNDNMLEGSLTFFLASWGERRQAFHSCFSFFYFIVSVRICFAYPLELAPTIGIQIIGRGISIWSRSLAFVKIWCSTLRWDSLALFLDHWAIPSPKDLPGTGCIYFNSSCKKGTMSSVGEYDCVDRTGRVA